MNNCNTWEQNIICIDTTPVAAPEIFTQLKNNFYDIKTFLTSSVNTFRIYAQNNLQINIENGGLPQYDVVVRFINSDKADIVNTSLPIDSMMGDTVYFSMDTLDVAAIKTIKIILDAKFGTVANLPIQFNSTIFSSNVDSLPSDNSDDLNLISVSSYDPNIKVATHTGYQISNWIEKMPSLNIRFIFKIQELTQPSMLIFMM
ncbi:MAG: hypothetical protein IPP29_04830 [Bacteroidetes bacterium]|nr:hypothetical protein [Bacteroidota bacterium]